MIESFHQILAWDGTFCLEVGNLARSMDTRIRPAGSINSDGLAGYVFNALFDKRLHGGRARLSLPTVEVSTVISKEQPDVPHAH